MARTGMADYAALIQWLVTGIALASSVWVGWLYRGPRRLGKIARSVGLTVAWGLGFTFVAVFANELCISYWHLCPDRGDRNMAYWFFPFFATPLYLVCMLAFGPQVEALAIEPSPHDKAVDAAVVQLQSHNKIHQRCPSCNTVIIAAQFEAANTTTTRRVNLRCACGKCDQLFDLRFHEAGGA